MDTGLFPPPEYFLNSDFLYNSRSVKKRFPELYKYLISKYPNTKTFSEKLYLYKHRLEVPPVCKMCGNSVEFINGIVGYRPYCSIICSAQDPSAIKKRENTNLKKYGVINAFQSEEIKKKIKSIHLFKYGVEYPSQSAQIQETRRKNSLKKYGVDHHGKTEEVRKKLSKSNRSYGMKKDNTLLGWDGDLQIRKCPHQECTKCEDRYYKIESRQYFARRQYGLELCTNLHHIQVGKNKKSRLEEYIRDFLESATVNIAPGETRSVIEKRGIDIYLPDNKLGIECNGDFWHSERNKRYDYHLKKYIAAKELGVQLIQIWDDQFLNHPEIVKSLILSKLGIFKTRIGARKCAVREINGTLANKFYNENHLQGQTRSSIHLGMYFKDDLVACMSFSKRSKLSGGQNDSSWELTRFCPAINTQIIGGAGKMLKYFIRKYKPMKIISFSSNDISSGNLYKKLGFIESGITKSYWYVHRKTNIRYHRTSFCKQRLAAMGYDIKNKTESEIMADLPYHKIWDAGHTKWVLNLE